MRHLSKLTAARCQYFSSYQSLTTPYSIEVNVQSDRGPAVQSGFRELITTLKPAEQVHTERDFSCLITQRGECNEHLRSCSVPELQAAQVRTELEAGLTRPHTEGMKRVPMVLCLLSAKVNMRTENVMETCLRMLIHTMHHKLPLKTQTKI
jgi:hypothetical protein